MSADRIPLRSAAPEAIATLATDGVAFVVPPGVAVPGRGTVERIAARPAHASGCACCTPRAALAEALHRLFIRRARGEVPFFQRIVVAAAPDALRSALADPLVAQRFRLEREAVTRSGFRCESGAT